MRAPTERVETPWMHASLLCRARARPGFGGAGRGAAGPRRGGACGARPRCLGRVARRVVARAAAGVGTASGAGEPAFPSPANRRQVRRRRGPLARSGIGRHRPPSDGSMGYTPATASGGESPARRRPPDHPDRGCPAAPRTGDKTRSTLVRWGRAPQPGGGDQPSGPSTREKDARQNQDDTGDDSPIEIFPEETRAQNQRGNWRHVRDK